MPTKQAIQILGEGAPALRRALLDWYAVHKRDLPWRRTSDPYAILVSELMLQQTQVRTALPYYERFMARFPDAAVLAAAPMEVVLAAWAGLGYYRRARYLKAAAEEVARRGAFPRDLEGLRALPGVGPYTAAAVGSIAFGLPEAVVDGNVIRVLARMAALPDDPTRGAGAAAVREIAQKLLDPKRPGDFNQALMELGAGPCAPGAPECEACPWQRRCVARACGKQADFPRLPERPKAQAERKVALLLARGAGAEVEVLACPREHGVRGRLGGFWRFPERESAEGKGEGEARAELEALGFSKAKFVALKEVRHRITVHDIRVLPWAVRLEGRPAGPSGWRWVALRDLDDLPLASAERRLVRALKNWLGTMEESGRGAQKRA